ncbi:MAG: SCO family protein [Paenisporosarcina sp.]
MNRYMKGISWLLLSAIILAGCNSSGFKAETDWQVEPFEHDSHRGEEISLDRLKGTVWLATFIFTNCTTVCAPMTLNMTEIQDELIAQGVEDYKFVAFSVDPEVDTPKVLTDYLSKFNVPDESKWNLLTGYDQGYMSQFARNSFKTVVQDDPNNNQVLHGTSFFLVDQNGVVVKSYTGVEGVPTEEIALDMKALIEDGK